MPRLRLLPGLLKSERAHYLKVQREVDNHGLRNCSILKGSWAVYQQVHPGADTQIIPHPDPRNQPTQPMGTAHGVLMTQPAEKKGKALPPPLCNSNCLSRLVGQPTTWRHTIPHTICLGKKKLACVYLARWRQAQERMKLPEPHRLCMCFLSMLLPMARAPSIFAA